MTRLDDIICQMCFKHICWGLAHIDGDLYCDSCTEWMREHPSES